ncbi:MAG TPA: AlkA N-terminal domain-containing protein [Burkholderiaceae bacterium]|nr:AlkA N-terminal domain-containing protein [Burkholderiaceae bacterium]
MTLHDDAAYRAISTRDARFDGRLFVGVTTTRVYCRPVCRVRLPRRENCRFFGNAALAEANGFRPCLRCRPELAPGLSLMDSSQALAQQAARTIEQAAHDGLTLSMPRLAARMGVTDRHLRRIFQQHLGVAPIDYLTTQRLLLAKQLLTDTALPVTQVALASGFASLRRFNAAFAERYRMNPSGLRRARDDADAQRVAPTTLRLRLAYRPPYQHDAMLRFFAARALNGIEAVDGDGMRRTVALPHRGRTLEGWMAWRFAPQRHEVELALAPELAPLTGALVQRTRQALDLDADPARIDAVLATMPLPARPGIRLPGSFDGFETAARVVLGQQVTVQAARTLTLRLVERFGATVATPFADLRRLFPQPEVIARADPDAIGSLGIVRQRVGALQALARAVCDGTVELHRAAPLHDTLQRLRALPGIGEWSAQVIAMRVLAWPDAFPASDIGVLNALGTRDVAAAAAQARAWQPWRSYAVMRLWQSLETA